MGRRKVDINEERFLALEIKKHPCLYNKKCQSYRSTREKANAWNRIESLLGFAQGEGEMRFRNMKRLFYKRKRSVRMERSFVVGTEKSRELQSAEFKLQEYDFLAWLEPFVSDSDDLYIGQGSFVRDLKERTIPFDHNDIKEEINDETDELTSHSEPTNSDTPEKQIQISCENSCSSTMPRIVHVVSLARRAHASTGRQPIKPSQQLPHIKCFQDENNHPFIVAMETNKTDRDKINLIKNQPLKPINQEQVLLTKTSNEDLDEDGIFGKMVANELRSLPKDKKIRLKHDINNSIFRYQCEAEQERYSSM